MPDQVDVGHVIEGQRSSRFQRSLILWLVLTMMVEGNDNQVAGYAAPAMIQALHIDRARFGAVFGVTLLGYMLGALVLGAAADRLGRRRIVIAGTLVFGVFTLATAYVTTLPDILILRFLAGIGLGAAVPSSVALMAEYAPTASRATRVALMFVAYTIGAALGGLIAAWLIPRFGWTSVYQVGGWTGVVLAVLLCFTLPESVRFLLVTQDRGGRRRRDLVRILQRLDPALRIGAATRLVSSDVVSHGVGVRHGVPVRDLFLDGRASRTVLLWIAYIGTQMTLNFLTSWLPTVVHQGGLSLEQAEVTTALFQFGGAAGSLGFGRLLDRHGLLSLAAGFLVAVPVVAALGIAGGSAVLLMGLAMAAGFCIPGGQAGVNALSGTIYPTYMRATGTGWAFGVGRIGSILGPVLGGMLLVLDLPSSLLFLFVAAPALCVAAALLLMRRVAGNYPQRGGAT
jgi:AAHS family 4-hydroxybenzoate transporter-like MFS transporter